MHLNKVIVNTPTGICKSFYSYPMYTAKVVTAVDYLLIFPLMLLFQYLLYTFIVVILSMTF